jgi:flagellar biosynthesis protein FlhF
MRLRTVTAPDARQAMAKLRAALGDKAIIVATQQVEGGVRITGAIEHDEVDLGDLLAAQPASPSLDRLTRVVAQHELPEGVRARLLDTARRLSMADPVAALGQALHQLYRFAPLPQAARLLLTGTPGAGKTASIAKLAARAVLEGRAVDVLTTDVGRAGGIEQLKSLLAPLRLEPRPAAEPSTLKRLAANSMAALVLIDSPGINPFRPADLGRLSQSLDASGAAPVLVLDAGTGGADGADVAETLAALGCRWLLVTKLDVARRLGGVLAAADAGLALGEAGIGPTIGRGLGRLTAVGLARLLFRSEPGADPAEQASAAPDLPSKAA